MAPRLRPLLTRPSDGTQMQSKPDLRMALKTGAGHGDLRLHPIVTRLVDAETLEKMGAQRASPKEKAGGNA